MKKIDFKNGRLGNTSVSAENLNSMQDNIEDGIHSLYNINNVGVKLIAHRGAMSDAPENTVRAWEIAKEQGVWSIETDVQKTADGNYIAFHDGTVDRMTDGTGNVKDMTLSQIQALTIDAGANVNIYSGQKIPMFEDFLKFCYLTDVVPTIELKEETLTVNDIEPILNLIKKYGLEKKCVVISFVKDLLIKLRELDSDISIQYIITYLSESEIDGCEVYRFDIDSRYASVTQDLVKYAHSKGLKVSAWTVDSTDKFESMKTLGLDFMATNSVLYHASYDKPVYENRLGIKAYSEYQIRDLINPSDFNGTLQNFIHRGLSTENASLKTILNCENNKNNAKIINRLVCLNRIYLDETTVLDLDLPEDFKIGVRFFDIDDNQIYNSSMGWTDSSKTSLSGFPSNAVYGYLYFAKTDDSMITKADIERLANCVKYNKSTSELPIIVSGTKTISATNSSGAQLFTKAEIQTLFGVSSLDITKVSGCVVNGNTSVFSGNLIGLRIASSNSNIYVQLDKTVSGTVSMQVNYTLFYNRS